MSDNEIVRYTTDYMNELNITDEDDIQDLFLLVFQNKENLNKKIDIRVIIYKAIFQKNGYININRKKKIEEETHLIPLSDNLLEYEIEDAIIHGPLEKTVEYVLFDRTDYKINYRERRIIALRFGIKNPEYNPENYENLTYRAIGYVMGISLERVRQIESKALRKLRHPSRSKHFIYYLHRR